MMNMTTSLPTLPSVSPHAPRRTAVLGCLLALLMTFGADVLAEDASGQLVPTPPAEDDDRPNFFDGIRGLIGDSPAFDEADATDSLIQSLNRAEDIYNEIRRSNRDAIRSMNRQVRIGQARRSPHLILLTVPQLRFDQLAAMPQLLRVRKSGITLTNYYAASDSLEQARWSLHSGKPAAQCPENGHLDRKLALPEVLWQSGYETAFIGTWANRQHPLELGFENWTGFPASQGVVQRYPEVFYTQTTQARILGSEGRPTALRLITDEAIDFLTHHSSSNQQFYLHVALPFTAGESSANNILAVDTAIGQIVDALNSLELSGRVCLLITGETSHQVGATVEQPLPAVDEILTYSQSGLNEGNLRTPLVVFWGGKTQRGDTSDFACSAIDLFPTLTAIAASQRAPRDLAGTSLTSELLGKDHRLERLIYLKLSAGGQAARRGRWKVIVAPESNQIQLFDLETDPAERQNIASEHPDIVQGFIAQPKKPKPGEVIESL